MNWLESLHNKIYPKKIFKLFTWTTRILLFLAFLPSGLKKIIGERFTILGIDTPVGFFFEALYQTGFYWNFIGFMQLLAGLLLLIPKTSFLGALLYFPIIINILVIVISMNFTGTPYIAGLMLIGNIYLLLWDYKKVNRIVSIVFES
ncbi:DoxX family protein [Flavobacteriaceae sp. LMIT009]